MLTNRRSMAGGGVEGGGGGGERGFKITPQDLRELMAARGSEDLPLLRRKFGRVQDVCDGLLSNPTEGISSDPEDLDVRREYYGSNVIEPKPPPSFLRLVFEALKDTTLIILQVAAVLSIVLSFFHAEVGGKDADEGQTILPSPEDEKEQAPPWIEGVAILAAVAVVVLVTAFNDYTKERQFRGLQTRIENTHTFSVVRSRSIIQVPISDILVGDICQIKYGDMLPADGLLIQGSDLKVDESSLTGESDHVTKTPEQDPFLFSGTTVMEGSGRMVVTGVGENSQAGIIMTLLGATEKSKDGKKKKKKEEEKQDPTERSVLQNKLSKLAIQIGYAGTVIAVLTIVILVVSFSVKTYLLAKEPFNVLHVNSFLHFFIIGVTVLVVAVPEGLPLAVTISLAFSVKKMMKDNNLVRHLDACETMGNATTICSDKTGTLTTNRMTVVAAHIAGVTHRSLPKYESLPQNTADLLVLGISINTNYTSKIVQSDTPGELPKQLGNKTECALLGFVTDMGRNYVTVRKNNPEEKFIKVYTFNSARKSMSTVVPLGVGGFRLFTKGASEMVVRKCGYVLNEKGDAEKLSEEDQRELELDIIEKLASDGLRTIGLAYRDFVPFDASVNQTSITEEPDWDKEEEIVTSLTLIAVVGVEDPVRPEVPKAIELCQRAGVTVRMVTGDNVNTARAIASKCGILRPKDDGLVMDSRQFNTMVKDENGEVSQDLIDKVWPRLRVLARSSPQDKYVLVKGIINSHAGDMRQVVAVTGDGTNDAPALKMADVGFAMGITGTDVAKEACDIVLTDDNFSSIVKAVMWGRNVYDSIAKFLQFQLTVNVVAVTVAFVSVCIISDSPLKTVQMLWVNLIMDTLASLALATEAPSLALLHRQPYGRTMPLVSAIMLRNIIGQAAFMVLMIFLLLFYGHIMLDIDDGLYRERGEPPSQHFTLIFNTFVMMTLFNEVNARKIHGEHNIFEGITGNPLFYCIWVVTFVAQVIIVQFGGYAFNTAPLTLDQWLWSVFFGVMTLLWGQLLTTVFAFIPSHGRSSSVQPAQGEEHTVSRDPLETSFIKKKRNAHVFWVQSITDLQTQIRVIRAFQSGLVEPLDAQNERGWSGGLGRRPLKPRPHSVSDNTSLDLLVDPEGSALPEVEGSR
ncbi:plasma membrane calcium-transporting ATPase 4-like [Portunus trituberculatus]|nr:plasma membrane calcium-transporting ATPase 4-like [Portunus trituberculatus]XP_045126515.1 plasma membrane calcium-transporting ATPase 4-like [Portunus trituberculatus]